MAKKMAYGAAGRRPLDGVRVIDLGTILAGPFGATLLGEFGAEIIKVEMPGAGDPLRGSGPIYEGLSFQWLTEARNKKSVTIDLRRPKGQEIVRQLVAKSDVVVENFRPGTLEGWGLGWEDLRQVNPRLVMVRASGFGQDGPYAGRPGYDRVGMALGGLTYISGYPETPPVRPGPAIADYMTATYGALGAVLALYHRDAQGSGEGQYVDVSLFETVFRLMEFTLGAYHKMGLVRERIGNGHPTSQPGESFLTKDGKWVTIACVGDRMFQRFARTVGRDDWLADPRFKTSAGRLKDVDEIHAFTREWVTQRTEAEVLGIMERAEIPCSPIYSIADIATDPHYEARGDILEVEDPRIGPVWMAAVTPRLSATPGAITAPAPDLGQHTRAVLRTLLGYSDAELDTLHAEGVI